VQHVHPALKYSVVVFNHKFNVAVAQKIEKNEKVMPLILSALSSVYCCQQPCTRCSVQSLQQSSLYSSTAV
jgi:hypothetical protein